MPNIDNNTLITAILGSGLISGIISAILNYITNSSLKTKEFELEYKKILLAKKIKGYEETVCHVSELVLGYRVFPKEYKTLNEPSNVKRFFIFKTDGEEDKRNPFGNYYRDIFETTMPNWYWYTESFRLELNKLFSLLSEINKEIANIEDKQMKKIEPEQLILIGTNYDKKLDSLGFSLMKIIRNDYPNLYSIK